MTTALAALQSVLPKSVALANELGFMMKFHRNYKSENTYGGLSERALDGVRDLAERTVRARDENENSVET